MPFHLIRQDITKLAVDAIVNAANSTLLGGGGVDGAIHRAAGAGLLAQCRSLGGCKTGDAKITGGYNLPAKYVIHTVGPIWRGGNHGEEELLTSCYRRSLELARDHGLQTVAFPLISSGVYGYPKDQALAVATKAIGAFLQEEAGDMTVCLVLWDRQAVKVLENRLGPLRQYIRDHRGPACDQGTEGQAVILGRRDLRRPMAQVSGQVGSTSSRQVPWQEKAVPSLEEHLTLLDESFSQRLLKLIDRSGMTDAQCYKKANISRKLFSKIRSDLRYRPSKPTVLAFAIALELSLEETKSLLMTAGFALSRSNLPDLIVEYYLIQGQYDILAINEALFAFDQPLLGGSI